MIEKKKIPRMLSGIIIIIKKKTWLYNHVENILMGLGMRMYKKKVGI